MRPSQGDAFGSVGRLCALWVAGLAFDMQLMATLEAKELTAHLGSPSSSDPPFADYESPESPADAIRTNLRADRTPYRVDSSTPLADEVAESVRAIPLSGDDDETLEMYGAVHQIADESFISQALTLTVPASVVTNVACNSSFATATWSNPIATSGCGGVTLACSGSYVPTAQTWDQTRVNVGGTFPAGLSEFCCHATDACAGDLERCWSVNVLNQTGLQISVELSPSIRTRPSVDLNRCLSFEVFQNCVEPPIKFTSTVTFGGVFNPVGNFGGVVNIPSAVFAQCVTVRDPQHTLRSCYTIKPGDCQSNGILKASFRSDPRFSGNWLIGGNLDGWRPVGQSCRGGTFDGQPCSSHFNCPGGSCETTNVTSLNTIDILDFGALVGEWLVQYDSDENGTPDGQTSCATSSQNHADINGDGLVDLLDFSFVSMNFFQSSLDCCCPGSVAMRSEEPVTSIPVDELRRAGRNELIKADLNRDGVLDLEDYRAFLQGKR